MGYSIEQYVVAHRSPQREGLDSGPLDLDANCLAIDHELGIQFRNDVFIEGGPTKVGANRTVTEEEQPMDYPPGVTGAELEIAGPDWEHEEDRVCGECGYEGPGYSWGYGRHAEWTCPECDEAQEWDPVEEDFWDRADDWRAEDV